MKKQLFELSTYEFAAVLLGYSPRQTMEMHITKEDGTSSDKIVGTYDEIMSVFRAFPEHAKRVEAILFDYDMDIDKTDAIKYIRFRTENYDPELTVSFYHDLDTTGFFLFDEIEADYETPEEYKRWKATSTYEYHSVLEMLRQKVMKFEKQGAIEPYRFSINGVPSCGISEIDDLFLQIKRVSRQYSENRFSIDKKSFKRKCYEYAKTYNEQSKKEAWIIDIVTILDSVYCHFHGAENEWLADCAVRLLAVLEVAFMSCKETICVKELCIQLGLCAMLDEEVEDQSPYGLPSRFELGLDPLTKEEIYIREELGKSVEHKQKSLCVQCLTAPCHYQYGQRKLYLCHDEEYKQAVLENKRTQRLVDRLMPEEARREIAVDALHSLSQTPLQEIQAVFSHHYWLKLIVSYLRKTGDPLFRPKRGEEDADQMERDDFIISTFPEDCPYEFERWRALYDDFCSTIQRNSTDKETIIGYFSELLWPLRKYNEYFFPSYEKPEHSRCSKALMMIAVSDLILTQGVIWSVYPDALMMLDKRADKDSLTPPQVDDILYRSMYELAKDTKDDERDALWSLGAFWDIMQKFGAVIDKSLRDMGMDFGLETIQERSGITVIEDTASIDDNYTFYWEDNRDAPWTRVVSISEDDKQDQSGQETVKKEENASVDPDSDVAPVPTSPRMNEYLSMASKYFVNNRWHNNNKKEYAIFYKVLYCAVFRKDWKNNTGWSRLQPRPLANGDTLTAKQLTGVMKGYDNALDDGTRNHFASLLGIKIE